MVRLKTKVETLLTEVTVEHHQGNTPKVLGIGALCRRYNVGVRIQPSSSSALLLSRLELSDTKVYEP